MKDKWVSVKDSLPDYLETVWVSDGKGWTTLGCRTDLFDDGIGGLTWCWAACTGIIYEQEGKIIGECEEDDWDVKYWHKVPNPPIIKKKIKTEFDFNTVIIKCPSCKTIQAAIIEHTSPCATYIHHCVNCRYIVMESEWNIIEPFIFKKWQQQ